MIRASIARPLFAGLAAVLLSPCLPAAEVTSPNGRIRVAVEVKKNLDPYVPEDRLYYSATFDGKPLLLDSAFRLDFKGAPPIAAGLVIQSETRKALDETWRPAWGAFSRIRNHANELDLAVAESGGARRHIHFIVRVFDDGFAFRYQIPEQPGIRDFKLAAERSEFRFDFNKTVWAANYGGFLSHQEGEYKKTTLNQIKPGDVIGCPLLIDAGPAWVALTEANLTDWAGVYFTGLPGAANAVTTLLSPHPDEPDAAVTTKAPRYSPWRVVMVGERPGDLIESNIVANLNDPSKIGDTSWVRPGVSAWDRWWAGSYAPDFPGKLGMSTASMKYFVDFAAEMGWQYQLTDWTWYGEPFDLTKPTGLGGNPKADLGKSIPELDVPELVRYAKQKGVGIWVWLEWDNANKQMERVFPLYEKWGVVGVKVDFMQRDDQWMVNFYERLTKLAAQHHLMVDFHGSYKPTGMERTYPNLLTREGVLGNENNKWSDRITPAHNVTLPFTRMLAGPMDYTPGGFRNKNRASFRVVGDGEPAPFVMTTRAQQLAMAVVYFSPLQVMCDSPYNYRISPAGLDFWRAIPTVWDESRVLAGYPGEFIVMARRSGGRWYIGGMNGDTARTVKLRLPFLKPGDHALRSWSDPDEAADYPDRVREARAVITAAGELEIKMATGGGFAAHIEPRGK
jgi:alpha-glucosidase